MSRPLLAAVAALAVVAPAPARAEPPVWVVRDANSEMVLFGSIHVLPPGLDWRPKALLDALAKSDDLWFEVPVDDATNMQIARMTAQAGILPPNRSLFALLPPADAAQLLRIADAFGVDKAALDRFQPWLAEIALAGALIRKAGASSEHGVEAAVSAAAPATAQRRALETPAQQIAILDGAPFDEQVVSLRETMREMEEEPDALMVLMRAWLAGDTKVLEREAYEELGRVSPAAVRRLLTDRNARWARQLDTRLKGKGRTVVVVGVGHLVGPDSVPAKLRALGYSVTGP
jgi:uncharacterized protein YbaP (TraB family)